MKTNRLTTENKEKAIILTGHPVNVSPCYVMNKDEYLTQKEAYCDENNIEVVSIINLPRFAEDIAWWMKELKDRITKNHVNKVFIHSNDFKNQLLSDFMLYNMLDSTGVEIVDEYEYLDDPDDEIELDPDAVVVTFIPEIKSVTKQVDMLEMRWQSVLQQEMLIAVAKNEQYVVDPMIFTAINVQETWKSFFNILDIYLETTGIEYIIVKGDGVEYKEFAKALVEYFDTDDNIDVLVSKPTLKLVFDSYELDGPWDIEEDEQELPFN